jgi:hypothetical protein
LGQRAELVYRLAIRGLRERCHGDRQFKQRTDGLTEKFRKDLPAVLAEARTLADEFIASVSDRR